MHSNIFHLKRGSTYACAEGRLSSNTEEALGYRTIEDANAQLSKLPSGDWQVEKGKEHEYTLAAPKEGFGETPRNKVTKLKNKVAPAEKVTKRKNLSVKGLLSEPRR